MKKNIQKERETAVFRDYARMGLSRCSSALEVVCRLRGMCRDATALDMLAVFDTLRLLELSGDTETVRAVREIYFATARRRIKQNEITLRIRRLADELHIDDRTVYRRLQKARELWHFLRNSEKKEMLGDRNLLTYLISVDKMPAV